MEHWRKEAEHQRQAAASVRAADTHRHIKQLQDSKLEADALLLQKDTLILEVGNAQQMQPTSCIGVHKNTQLAREGFTAMANAPLTAICGCVLHCWHDVANFIACLLLLHLLAMVYLLLAAVASSVGRAG